MGQDIAAAADQLQDPLQPLPVGPSAGWLKPRSTTPSLNGYSTGVDFHDRFARAPALVRVRLRIEAGAMPE